MTGLYTLGCGRKDNEPCDRSLCIGIGTAYFHGQMSFQECIGGVRLRCRKMVCVAMLALASLPCFSQHGRHAAFEGRNERPANVPDSPWETYIGWFDSLEVFHITDSTSAVDSLTGWMHNVCSDGKFLFWSSMNRSRNGRKIILGYGYIPIENERLVPAGRVAYSVHRRLDPEARVGVEFSDHHLEIATWFGVYHVTRLRLAPQVYSKEALKEAMRRVVSAAKGYPKHIRADFIEHLLDSI